MSLTPCPLRSHYQALSIPLTPHYKAVFVISLFYWMNTPQSHYWPTSPCPISNKSVSFTHFVALLTLYCHLIYLNLPWDHIDRKGDLWTFSGLLFLGVVKIFMNVDERNFTAHYWVTARDRHAGPTDQILFVSFWKVVWLVWDACRTSWYL